MPNHVKNILHINADEETRSRIWHEIQDDEIGIGSIDFNKLIPMPKELHIESSSMTDQGIELYLTSINPLVPYYGKRADKIKIDEYVDIIRKLNENKSFSAFTGTMSAAQIESTLQKYKDLPQNKNIFFSGKQAVENVVKYGSKDWYDWAIKNWGTKWNAYEFEKVNEDTITFETAWSAPHPILNAISEKYPKITFSHSWADEDIGSNVGKRIYINGEIMELERPANLSKDAYEMAADIWRLELKEYGLHLSEDGATYEYVENADANEDDEEMEH